jgi:hypothetical protein
MYWDVQVRQGSPRLGLLVHKGEDKSAGVPPGQPCTQLGQRCRGPLLPKCTQPAAQPGTSSPGQRCEQLPNAQPPNEQDPRRRWHWPAFALLGGRWRC